MDNVKFAVFTDLHHDQIHDGENRVNKLVEKLKDDELDFVIQLGDFAHPSKENQRLIDKISELEIPFYSVVGNHDTDQSSRKEVMEFLKIKQSYYSFKRGNIKFIILDSCFVESNNVIHEYDKKHYNTKTDTYPIVPDHIMDWLRRELDDESEYYVIFSHHSPVNEFGDRGIFNRIEIQELISHTNGQNKRVLFYMNGHDHGEDITKIDATYFFALNSISNIWIGPKYETFPYEKEIHDKYPMLKNLILYDDPLHAIVTIDRRGSFKIEGMKSSYQHRSPQELEIGDAWNGRSILPRISSLTETVES